MAFLTEVARIISDAGHGTLNVNIFLSSKAVIPDGDGPFVRLRETGGSSPDYTQNSSLPAYQYPTVQIVVTATRYQDAESRARQIYNDLAVVRNTEVNGTYYVGFKPLNEPSDVLGLDNQERAQCSFNVMADKRPS